MKRIIGLRTIKTAVCMLIVLMLYIILKLIDEGCNLTGGGKLTNWYNPFFAGIAVAYSLYPDKISSFKQGKNRCIASLIGGIVGILLVCFYRTISGLITNVDGGYWPNLSDGESVATDYILPYLLVSIFVIVDIVIGNRLKQKPAVFVSILTLISVTINPMNAIVKSFDNPYIGELVFGTNRILSTFIGVFVSLFINIAPFPHRNRNKDMVFFIDIDDILKGNQNHLEGYMHYKMNHLVYSNIHVSYFTNRITTYAMDIYNDVKANEPLIVMNGAALYDPKTLKYIYHEDIDKDVENGIDEYLNNINVTPFKYSVSDNVLNIFTEKANNKAEDLEITDLKNRGYGNFFIAKMPNELNCVQYLIIDEGSLIDKIINDLNQKYADSIFIQEYSSFLNEAKMVDGLKYIKIFSKNILKLEKLKEYYKNNRIVGITTSLEAKHLLDNSVIKMTTTDYENDHIAIKNYEECFSLVSKAYYDKKYKIKD